MAAAQTFEYGKGRIFIAGLFWQPLPSVAAAARKLEIEKIAKEQDFDLMVVRTTGVLQVGFCSSGDGAKPGMLSIAAVISKAIEVEGRDRNLLCAVEIADGQWLYVAQREGVILHDGDLLGSEDEIRSRMLTDLSVSDWETIFAPDHWAIPGSIDRAFKDFFPHKGDRIDYKKWWALQPVKKSLKAYIPFVALVCVGLVVAFGYMHWQKYKVDQELAIIAAQQAAQYSASNPQTIKVEHPWKSQPRALKFAAACDEALAQVTTLWPGNWAFNEATCAAGALTVLWGRQEYGWIEHLQAVQPKAVLSVDGTSATLVLPLAFTSGEDEQVPAAQARSLDLYKAAQKYGYKVMITAPMTPAVLPGDKPAAQNGSKDWNELSWSATGSSLSPSVALQTMEGSGFRVNSIKKTFAAGLMNWSMEGVQYVQP